MESKWLEDFISLAKTHSFRRSAELRHVTQPVKCFTSRRWEEGFGPLNTRLLTLNVHDAVMAMVDGGCDLLLCYHHPRQPVQLDTGRYGLITLGSEVLRSYAHCNKASVPDYHISPGSTSGTVAVPVLYQQYLSLPHD